MSAKSISWSFSEILCSSSFLNCCRTKCAIWSYFSCLLYCNVMFMFLVKYSSFPLSTLPSVLFSPGIVAATLGAFWVWDEGCLLILPAFLLGSSSSSLSPTGYLPISYLISRSCRVGVFCKKLLLCLLSLKPNFFLVAALLTVKVSNVLLNRNGLAPFFLLSSLTLIVCWLSSFIVVPPSSVLRFWNYCREENYWFALFDYWVLIGFRLGFCFMCF